MSTNKYKRILLKLSGEALEGSQGYGIDPEQVLDYAKEIKQVVAMGVEVAIVIGGGNIYRGAVAERQAWIGYKATIWVCWPL